jgi:hypothetical protein
MDEPERPRRPTPEHRRVLERVLSELAEVQAGLDFDCDAEGYLGEARGAIALALGRHAP